MPPRKAAQTVDIRTPAPSITPAADRNDSMSEETRKSLARWTDEQEIALLKGIVRWKPVGWLLINHQSTRMLIDGLDKACISTFA
jgi:hypothetical protein